MEEPEIFKNWKQSWITKDDSYDSLNSSMQTERNNAVKAINKYKSLKALFIKRDREEKEMRKYFEYLDARK